MHINTVGEITAYCSESLKTMTSLLIWLASDSLSLMGVPCSGGRGMGCMAISWTLLGSLLLASAPRDIRSTCSKMEAEDSCSFVPLIGGGPVGERRNGGCKNPLLSTTKNWVNAYIFKKKTRPHFYLLNCSWGTVRINPGATHRLQTHSCCGCQEKTQRWNSSLPILFFPGNHHRKEKEVKQIKDHDEIRLTLKKVEKSLMNWALKTVWQLL